MSRRKSSRGGPPSTPPRAGTDPVERDGSFELAPGTLYLVAIPIGNAADLSRRARDVLNGADVIAAEDTRVFRDLARYAALEPRATRIVSYHAYNEAGRAPWLLERLAAGESVALVSDAGTPGINDPGGVVVRAAIDANRPIVCVPGACAAIAALSISGLRTDRFHYVGFLPRRGGRRARALEELADLAGTLIFYEAPQRVIETLGALHHAFGDRQAVVTRNLTKPTESIRRGALSELQAALQAGEPPRGEFTLLVAGADLTEPALSPRIEALIERWVARGAEPSMVRDLTQELLHIRRGALYDRVLEAQGNADEEE